MTRNSHHSMPRTGTFWNKKDEDFCTAMVVVSGWIRVVDGVTTIEYCPSWVFAGTTIVPTNRPLLSDIVEFVARTVAPLRSSIANTTPPMPFELESRTYPVTLTAFPETTDWPLVGVRIAVNPAGGGWTFKVKGWFCRTVIVGLAGATVRSGPVRTWTARPTLTDFVLLSALIAGYGSKSTAPGPVVAAKATVSW